MGRKVQILARIFKNKLLLGHLCSFSWPFSIWPSQPLQQPPLLWRVWFYFLQQNFLHRSFQHPKKHEKISLFFVTEYTASSSQVCINFWVITKPKIWYKLDFSGDTISMVYAKGSDFFSIFSRFLKFLPLFFIIIALNYLSSVFENPETLL